MGVLMDDLTVYELEPVDNFQGLVYLKDYVNLAKQYDGQDGIRDFLSLDNILIYLIKCLTALLSTGWNEKIRYGNKKFEIAIGAIPMAVKGTKYLLVKQDNGGTCYVISEYEFLNNQYESLSYKIKDPNDLMKIFNKAIDLSYKILDDSMKCICSKEHHPHGEAKAKSSKVADRAEIADVFDVKNFRKIHTTN